MPQLRLRPEPAATPARRRPAAKHQHLAPRQQRAVQPQTTDFRWWRRISVIVPSSTTGQKPVLLCSVEAVDFVHEQQGAIAGTAPPAGFLEHAFQIGDTREHGRKSVRNAARRERPAGGQWWSSPPPAAPTEINDASEPRSSMRANVPSGPRRWSWPTTSSRLPRTQTVGERTGSSDGRGLRGGGLAEQVGGGVVRVGTQLR